MESKIAEALGVRYYPVPLLWTDEKTERVLQLNEGRWDCVMWMLVTASKGKTLFFDRTTKDADVRAEPEETENWLTIIY